MFQYILKRILIFIPTLFVISFVIFMLSVYAPGDPVENLMTQQVGGSQGATNQNRLAGEETYLKIREELNLDKPTFYFKLSTSAYPDTLYRIIKKRHQAMLSELIWEYGNWPQIESYYKSLKKMEESIYKVELDSVNGKARIKVRDAINSIYIESNPEKVRNSFDKAEKWATKAPSTSIILPIVQTARSSFEKVLAEATPSKNYIPSFKFYGTNNQYHKWISGLISFNFGKSYRDRRPIADKIKERIPWTIGISLVAIIIIYLVSIPAGVFSAVNSGTTADSIISTTFFALYSLPSFWIATLLIIFLCQPEYLNIFPAYGVGTVEPGMGFFDIARMRVYHLILPMFCWTYGGFAFLSRQMRGGMLSVLREDYIRTARAKGLSERSVIWKHTFRNSLLPIITLFANVFPRMVGGSVVLETIFTIPGMGKMLFDAMIYKDYPEVFTVVMLTAVLTMVGYLVSDILYAVVDPRISYK